MLVRRLLLVATACSLTALGCAARSDDSESVGDSAAELTTLDASRCATPNVASAPKTDASGRPIRGTARTTVDGCIIGHAGETGSQLLGRAAAILNDTNRFGTLTDANGQRVFNSFRPSGASGSLATSLVQDVDVSLNADFSPSTRLRVTRQSADASYNLSLVNVTPVQATVIFPVTAVRPNNLTVRATLKAEANGITISGVAEVALEVQQDRASESTDLVKQLFAWLNDQLS
jgi:hypothetical protein